MVINVNIMKNIHTNIDIEMTTDKLYVYIYVKYAIYDIRDKKVVQYMYNIIIMAMIMIKTIIISIIL